MRLLAALVALIPLFADAPSADPRELTRQAHEVVLDPGGREQAENLLRQAIDLYEKQSAKTDDYADALTLLAMLRHPAMAANKEALGANVEPLARKALEIRKQNPDTKSADLALDCELEAMVLEEMGRLEDSRDPKAKARALRDQIIIAMLPPTDLTRQVEHLGGPDILSPRLIARPEPEYSFAGKVLKMQANIMAELVIEADGSVRYVEIFQPAGFGLDEAAVASLLKWRFVPAQKNGVPVPVEANVRIRFHLPGMPILREQ